MTSPRRAPGASLLLLALMLLSGLGACGGKADEPADRAAAAKAYTAQVSKVSRDASARLGQLADRSDYRDGATAARSTRAYAAAIRDAARGLRAARAPQSVAGSHRALVELYDDTASSLDALATRFAAARDAVDLAALAQEFGEAVQRYASQESGLRTAILGALGEASATSPGAAPATADGGAATSMAR
ncbi:MAG: hypothetical protein PGN13_14435 [Patulibacter minatonensis]